MRRLIVLFAFLVVSGIACRFEIQTLPRAEKQPETPSPSPATMTAVDVPGNPQALDGPGINYNGVRFTLDPALGSHLYVFDDVTTIDGSTAHNTRLALAPEEYCQTWCLMVYPIAEFEQAFGTFVFPPSGYRGGAAVVFKAQETVLSFQNGSGERGLETFGQNQFGVSNESLKYVFRGYSVDKKYGIFVQVPVHTASLPATAPTLTTGGDPAQDILAYNKKAAQSLEALAPADFSPNLDLLDALVASIHVGTP